MKNLIFVTWLYFQILLVQCDIFVNNLNESDANIKMCINKTVNHLFSQNDTLSLILNSDLCEDAIFEMNTMRPYIVLNMEATNDVKLQYNGQFIICPNDVHSLNRTIHSVRDIAQSNKRGIGNSKILVITNMTNASSMFEMLWLHGINNVIILVYGQGTSKLFMCNRFAPENECGKAAKLIIDQDCGKQLSFSFTNVIHQMNKCTVTFTHLLDDFFSSETNQIHSSALAVLYIIKELSNRFNATFDREIVNEEQELNFALQLSTKIVISWAMVNQLDYYTITEPLARTDVLWMVPRARQIFNMNACLQVFNYDVWIATSVVFISASLTWFLIISFNGEFTFDKLCLSFLNVWSLTICGNVAQLPRSLALRILLLFYLIYAMNMQFAFTSDMSTVLTAPRYGFQIRNLEELADYQLPIYVYYNLKRCLFSKNMTDRKLYTKLQNSMHNVNTIQQLVDHMLNLHLYNNYAVVSVGEDLRHMVTGMNMKIEAYKVIDNSMSIPLELRLCLHVDHYFATTLNTFISRMEESGIYNKHKNDLYDYYHTETVDTMQEDELTLKHLIFIFIFFGFGLCTACMVFCFELVLHKYL